MNFDILLILVLYGIAMVIFGVVIGYLISKFKFYRDMDRIIKMERKIAISSSKAVIKGKVSEQIFPLTPFFKYKLSDARFLGTPVDYIVFDGYSELEGDRGVIREIVFIEVKTGRSQLSNTELAIKDAIDNKRVKFDIVYLDSASETK
ncbi:MAG: Holliday junction resolvase-like protein [Brevinematia bacterium]